MSKYYAESERLWLQPLNVEEHLDDFHAFLSHPKALEWSPSLPSQSLSESRTRLITKQLPSTENPSVETYAVLLKSSAATNKNGKPTMIGTIGMRKPADEPVDKITPAAGNGAAPGLAYGLRTEYQGKGYATEALRLMIKDYWARGEDSKELTVEIDPTNTASENVAKKLGFVRGERLEAVYQLWKDVKEGNDIKRDIVVWHLKRPE